MAKFSLRRHPILTASFFFMRLAKELAVFGAEIFGAVALLAVLFILYPFFRRG